MTHALLVEFKGGVFLVWLVVDQVVKRVIRGPLALVTITAVELTRKLGDRFGQ